MAMMTNHQGDTFVSSSPYFCFVKAILFQQQGDTFLIIYKLLTFNF